MNNLYIYTVFYGPVQFLEESLKHNYNLFKKENVKFKHYLLDNNFPLESEKDFKQKIKSICNNYDISYLNVDKNLGMIGSHLYFANEIQKTGIQFSLESDAYLKTQGTLSSIVKLHSNDLSNLIYLNTDYLNDYPKKIFKINDINLFELELKNDYKQEWTWLQSFSVNIENSKKINSILSQKKDNYDVPGESSANLKKQNLSMLVMDDFFDDMDIFRYSNYIEYLYYKALIYFWSKVDINLDNLSFDFFIKNYDYYLNTYYFSEFSRDLLSNPKFNRKNVNFKFDKTKKKFYKSLEIKIFKSNER